MIFYVQVHTNISPATGWSTQRVKWRISNKKNSLRATRQRHANYVSYDQTVGQTDGSSSAF